ncbi:hypothetical protein H6G33_17870 [Calothrix sp. FACHB-1219]|uniref:hypothetical protein n=1 Tax=unclassified Calothrix TaxID=2619626 RepID=UPI00168790CE|nr:MULTISPECIES: hypothetical protein [unclassified Calothrix]MBD2202747.1 hypothetical protein [Calothrix sp. FACHB-168]MBD2218900.1 hypothetical protein [Calothrix sp. FACHB-1219]
MNAKLLFLQIEIFFGRLQAGEYDHPFDLAMALENLANLAWDEVEEIYQASIRIDP